MRWIACLVATSASVLVVLSCTSGKQNPKPQSQQTASTTTRETKPMSSQDESQVRAAAQKFLNAFRGQDFDTMWAMTAAQSKQKIGLPNFIRQNSYAEKGSIISCRIDKVGGLGPGRALVTTVMDFMWNPSFFADGDTTTLNLEDEWTRAEDGQWYRVIAEPDPKRLKELEEMCANNVNQATQGHP